MTIKLTAKKWGNSLGVILDKEARELLGGLEENDVVYLTKAPDGVRVTTYSPDFEEQMSVARKIMKKRRNVLRELAK